MDTLRIPNSVTNIMTVMMEFQKRDCVQMVLSLIHIQERGNHVIITSMLTAVTDLISVSLLDLHGVYMFVNKII